MLTVQRLLGLLVVLKAVDVLGRGPQDLPAPAWAAVLALWTAAGLLLAAGRTARPVWAAVLVAGAGIAVDLPLELRRQHLVLLMGVALAATVAQDDRERLLLWRLQLTVLYAVAALAKLNESFLGGDVLAVALAAGPLGLTPPAGLLVPVGVALVAVEAALAVWLWRPRRVRLGVGVAAALHLSALAVAAQTPLVGLRLVVFGGTAVVLYAACAQPAPRPAGVRPSGTPARAGRPR